MLNTNKEATTDPSIQHITLDILDQEMQKAGFEHLIKPSHDGPLTSLVHQCSLCYILTVSHQQGMPPASYNNRGHKTLDKVFLLEKGRGRGKMELSSYKPI